MTPKGGGRPQASRRYTPPAEPVGDHAPPSPAWLPVLIAVLIGIGVLAIVGNYTEIAPGSPTNAYLLVGLGFILAGTIVATRWR